eukprot:TRINITY_DN2848_c0_g1_i2.p1 TRINITY_DN2848_c0_g1~~TRINITY_DN2848_c0_g1_i2.p1  ORF type:complete len:1783 (-),score=388.42 TRINITY_DN2848_c0_g1_i2:58-5316(-)
MERAPPRNLGHTQFRVQLWNTIEGGLSQPIAVELSSLVHLVAQRTAEAGARAGQLLYALFLAEQFLQQLQQRGRCAVQVIAFDGLLLRGGPGGDSGFWYLLQEVLLQHKALHDAVPFYTFRSWTCAEWVDHERISNFECVLVEPAMRGANFEQLVDLVAHLQAARERVMLIDVLARASRIYSYGVLVRAEPKAASATAAGAPGNWAAKTLEPAWSCAVATAQKEGLQCGQGTLVLAAACAACLVQCHGRADAVQFCKAMLLHHAVALALPLGERCFAVDADPASPDLAFFNAVCLYAGSLVHEYVRGVSARSIYDLVDIRIFNAVLRWLIARQCCLQSEFCLADDTHGLLTGTWAVMAACSQELGLQCVKLPAFFDQTATAMESTQGLAFFSAPLAVQTDPQHIIQVTHPLMSVCSKADEVLSRYCAAADRYNHDDGNIIFANKFHTHGNFLVLDERQGSRPDAKKEKIEFQRTLRDTRAKILSNINAKCRMNRGELNRKLYTELKAHHCSSSPAFVTEAYLVGTMLKQYGVELSRDQLGALRVQCNNHDDKLNLFKFLAFLFKKDNSLQLEARAFERFKGSFKVNAVPHKEDIIRCRSDAKGVDFFDPQQSNVSGQEQVQTHKKKAAKPGSKAAIKIKKEQSGVKQQQLLEEGQTESVARLEEAVLAKRLGTEEATREVFSVLQRKNLLKSLPGILLGLKYAFNWAQATRFPRSAAAHAPAVVVCRLCLDAVQLHRAQLLPKSMAVIKGYLSQLGFAPAAQQLCAYYLKGCTAALTPAERAQLSPGVSRSPPVLSFARFQMMCMGPVLHRMFDSAPDPRVGFDPDKWQRDLLTCVDTGKCCLVVAPTSSGKTFISYYAMQRTYEANRSSNRKQLVVYVAPTKALVQQVAAETSNQLGCEVGIFTRDYRKSVDTCDVLVTVPQILEMLLLSPSWGKRLNYCIFDEVHCINTQASSAADVSSGVVWETCIKLVPCPYLALSATVGNAAQFHCWLQSVQAAKFPTRSAEYPNAHEVVFISHDHRFVDIETSCYSPESQQLVDVHPLAVVPSPVAHPRKFVSALNSVNFTPKECCMAYDELRRVATLAAPERSGKPVASNAESHDNDATSFAALLRKVEELEPGAWFPDWRWITRADVFNYEARLKALAEAIADSRPDVVDSWLAAFPFPKVESMNDTNFYDEHLIPLLRALEKNDDLPALFFVLHRGLCDCLVENTFEFLDNRERETETGLYAKDQTPDKSSARKKGRDKDTCKTEEERREQDEAAFQTVTLEKMPLRDGSFARFVPKDNFWLQKCKNCPECEQVLVAALQRGIASHHAGLSKSYRRAVEALFREGYIRVIFATSTLALGINVPARSVVFSNNSSFLTPLMFQQMRGRAGRRGLDNIGKCIFANFPIPRTSVLLTASLPSIQGDTPLSISLVLRTLVAYHECNAEQRQTAARRFCVASYPPLLTSREAPRSMPVEQTLFRIGIDFLAWSNILSPAGEPIKFAGVVHNLHYFEPGNIILAHLLNNGIIQRACDNFFAHPKATARNLMHILCAIFSVIPAPTHRPALSNSVSVLPPLPDFVSAALGEYYAQTLRRFKFYCSCLCDAATLSKVDFQLPLSGTCFDNTGCVMHKANSKFMQFLHPVAPGWRSLFVSLTGPENPQCVDAATIARSTAELDPSFIPVPDTTLTHVNAYALDFHKHGILRQIEEVNMLGHGAWEKLFDWCQLLKACHQVLARMAKDPDNDPTVQAFRCLSQEFKCKFRGCC